MIFLLCLLVLQIADIGSNEVQPRIYNGQIAKPGEFPYLVGIKVHNTLFKANWCSGNIISNEWILTAAHCFDDFFWLSNGYIYFGSTVRETGSRTTFYYLNVVKHPAYTPILNDLALIKIARIRFSDTIKSIPLPSSKDRSQSYANPLAFTAGWNVKDQTEPEQLMWTKITIASDLECRNKYSTNGEVLCGRVQPGSSLCRGDSGGPLVHQEKRTLVGVSSFVEEGSCDNGQLVAFAHVVNYLDWIYSVSGVKPIN